jgi:hypothetical protein
LVFTLLREARIGAVSERASHRFLFVRTWLKVAAGWELFAAVNGNAGLLLLRLSRVSF